MWWFPHAAQSVAIANTNLSFMIFICKSFISQPSLLHYLLCFLVVLMTLRWPEHLIKKILAPKKYIFLMLKNQLL